MKQRNCHCEEGECMMETEKVRIHRSNKDGKYYMQHTTIETCKETRDRIKDINPNK